MHLRPELTLVDVELAAGLATQAHGDGVAPRFDVALDDALLDLQESLEGFFALGLTR
jgi:hypothetical protein